MTYFTVKCARLAFALCINVGLGFVEFDQKCRHDTHSLYRPIGKAYRYIHVVMETHRHTHNIYKELSMGQESMFRAVKTFLLAPHPGRVLYAVVQKKNCFIKNLCVPL